MANNMTCPACEGRGGWPAEWYPEGEAGFTEPASSCDHCGASGVANVGHLYGCAECRAELAHLLTEAEKAAIERHFETDCPYIPDGDGCDACMEAAHEH